MEKATSVEEIRALICSHLDPWEDGEREDLVNAALISHAWTNAALDILWSDVIKEGQFSHLIAMLGEMDKGWEKEVSWWRCC